MKELQHLLCYNFKNLFYLEKAMIHPSYRNEREDINYDNQTLEFVGDAVINLVVSSILFKRCPDLNEGELTKMKSEIVRKERLLEFAKSLNLGKYLYLGKGENLEEERKSASLLADAFEAVIGAVFIDGGFEIAEDVIEKIMGNLINEIIKNPLVTDYKSKLQEIVQKKFRKIPYYKVIKETGPEHKKTFFVSVKAGKHIFAEGKGNSKKEAEQDAAKSALKLLE